MPRALGASGRERLTRRIERGKDADPPHAGQGTHWARGATIRREHLQNKRARLNDAVDARGAIENVRRNREQSGASLNKSVDAKGTSLCAVTHFGIMIFEVAAEPVAAFFACNEKEIIGCGWFEHGQDRRLTGICDGARW